MPLPENNMSHESSSAEFAGEHRETPWYVYLIECFDGSIYTGIAIDVAARYAAHASGKGARYTRSHPPARLLASMKYPDHSSALQAEYRIKQLKPALKRRFVAGLSVCEIETAVSDQSVRAIKR